MDKFHADGWSIMQKTLEVSGGSMPTAHLLAEDFQRMLTENDYSQSTCSTYLRFVEPFLKENPHPAEMDRYDVGRYILKWRNQLSNNSMKLATSALIKFYKYLKFYHGFRRADAVIDHIQDLKGEFFRTPSFQPDPMSEDELSTLFQYTLGANPRQVRRRNIITILLGTGLRVSEFCAVRRDQVAIHEPGVQSHIFVPGGKTASARRKIPLHRDFPYSNSWILGERVVEAFDSYEKVRPVPRTEETENFWFISERGQPISKRSVQAMFTRLCEKSGLQKKRAEADENSLSVHNLRHTFATQLAMQGANAYQIKAILGHASVSTSQAYIRLLDRVG